MTQKIFQALIISIIFLFGFSLFAAGDIPRIRVDQLKEMLGNPEVVIIDVRSDRDWEQSDAKIKGALREKPQAVDSWAGKYPPDKTIVLYCA